MVTPDRTRRRVVAEPTIVGSPPRAGSDEFAEAVLEVVSRIPPGRVLSYGDVAEYLGYGGPRSVGRVMSTRGSGVPWWRVVRADGSVVPELAGRANRHHRNEGTPLRPDGLRVDMRQARWDGEPRCRAAVVDCRS